MPQQYYAVKNGRNCGVYNTWEECKKQVEGFSSAEFKKFKLLKDAEEFVSSRKRPLPSSNINTYPEAKKFRVDTACWSTAASSSTSSCFVIQREVNTLCTKRETKFVGRRTKLIDFKNLPPTTSDIVYTDGACKKNGRITAKGGIGVYWGPGHHLNVSKPLEGRQTNNRAEIMAVVTAVRQAKEMGLKKLTVRTDSQFLIFAITRWIHKWKRNGWKLITGGLVKNKEDFEELDEAQCGIEVNYEYVKGHSGDVGNEAADKLARDGVR